MFAGPLKSKIRDFFYFYHSINNRNWTDAKKKSKEKSSMQTFKTFRPDGVNKQIDLIKINVSYMLPYRLVLIK